MEYYFKKGLKHVFHFGTGVISSSLCEFALPLSFMIASKPGNLIDKLNSSYQPIIEMSNKIINLYDTSSTRNLMENLRGDFLQIYNDLSQNIDLNTEETLYTIAATYIFCKATPHLFNLGKN